MKITFFIICIALIISCRSKSDQTNAATENKNETYNDSLTTPKTIDSMTAIKNRADYMRPGDFHKMIAAWEGEWAGAATLWKRPDTTAVFSQVTSVNKMGMGGRYLIMNETGKIQDSTFEGMGMLGYDNVKKLFVSSWIDNFGTGITNLEGSWNPAKNEIELKGRMIDPATGREANAEENIRIIDNNNQFVELYLYPGKKDKELKLMEIKFSRSSLPSSKK